uniref:GPI inositol-deacylase n=1 Tax=Arundo donax TaxID=35708 RepID=A0A0A9DIJ0_ARUDO
MEDYFSRFVNLSWQLRQYLTQLIENLLGCIDWIPQCHEVQFSACYERSFPATGYIHEGAYVLSVGNIAEDQPANVISEGTVFRKGFSSVCQRSYGRSSPLLHGIRLVQRLAFHVRDLWSLFSSEIHAKLTRILHRFWTTLQGSCEDIGWLQRTKASVSSVDGTGRFRELLHDVRSGVHYLPDTLVYLFIPGLFSNHSPLYFVNTKRFFSKMGLTCHVAKIHSEASVEKNAWELKQYTEELYWGSGKQVLLLGHSKGGVDAAAAISLYWSELKGKVAGLALVQSPYGGTPVASDILREGQIADKETRRIMELVICKLIKGDMRALEDLTYDKRKDFISKHKLPVDELPIISFHTEASTAPTVLATLTRVAQAELLPCLPLPRFFFSASEFVESMLASLKVPVVAPVSAAMAVIALHLRLRYGERSDGLVTRRDAEVPGSVVVRPDRRLDHAWMVYSTLRKGSAEADASEMCEALLAMLVEIGRKKKFC